MASPYLKSLPRGFRIDPRLGAVYDANPHSADDLTVIRGIETREAVGLNRLGIYFCEQLASWTDSEEAAVADALGMSVSTVRHSRWSVQARDFVGRMVTVSSSDATGGPSPERVSKSALPAPVSRTVAVMVCALLTGWLLVSWLNHRTHPPVTGIVVAEITSLRVPADSRLLELRVTAGDEVFTGETLLTLEKFKHLEDIESQAQRVQKLAEDLRRIEAQAELELQWRSQHVHEELQDARRRAEFFRTLDQPHLSQPAGITSTDNSLPPGEFQTVSTERDVMRYGDDPVNSLVFISGTSGTTTLKPAVPQSSPTNTVPLPEPQTSVDTQHNWLQLEVRNIQARIRRLEELSSHLPAQVRQAAGIESIHSEHKTAQKHLAQIRSLSRETSVLCPAYGIISEVRYQAGARMRRDDVMMKIVHPDRRYIVVHGPTERFSHLEPGAHVTIVFPEHENCQGVLASLPRVEDTQIGSGESFASLRIESVGREWPELPVGSRVEVLLQ